MSFDWKRIAEFDERSAIREFCGDVDAETAEQAAWAETFQGKEFPDRSTLGELITNARDRQREMRSVERQPLLFDPIGSGTYEPLPDKTRYHRRRG